MKLGVRWELTPLLMTSPPEFPGRFHGTESPPLIRGRCCLYQLIVFEGWEPPFFPGGSTHPLPPHLPRRLAPNGALFNLWMAGP